MKHPWLKLGLCLGITSGIAAGLYFSLNHFNTSEIPTDTGGFSGIIVNGLNNEPLHGAVIDIVSDNGHPVSSTNSDENGLFAFDLNDGNYALSASFPGFTHRGKNDVSREIAIQDSTRFVNARVRLWPQASIHGRVIAGDVGIHANVVFHYDRDSSGAEDYDFTSLSTADDGSFSIPDAYAGLMTVSIHADGFASTSLRDIVVKAGQNIDLGDIPLRDGVSIYGTITDATTNRGISHAQINILDTDRKLLEKTTSDASGQFRLPPLALKRVSVAVTAAGYRDIDLPLLLKGNANKELNLSMQRAWGLSLDIQNLTGRPPIETHITITSVATDEVVYEHTYPNGIFHIDSLKGGPFIIEAESVDRITHQVIRASGGDEARIRLKPLPRIIFTPLDSHGNVLTKGEYRYQFRPTQSEDPEQLPWVGFAIEPVPINDLSEGYYKLELRTNDSKEVSSPEFFLKNGDVREISLQLTEGGVLKGHVVSTEYGYNVSASISIEGTTLSTHTDKEGYFVLDKLPTEAFNLLIKPDRDSQTEGRFDGILVNENDTLEREFRVSAPKTDRRERRRERMEERRARGEFPRPPWGDGQPPWGDGPPPAPPWGDGQPPWGDGPPPAPPWGDGQPPWGDGEPPAPPWGDGQPPWGDGQPPWGDGQPPAPPWGNGQPPGANSPETQNNTPTPQTNQPSSRQNGRRPSPRALK